MIRIKLLDPKLVTVLVATVATASAQALMADVAQAAPALGEAEPLPEPTQAPPGLLRLSCRYLGPNSLSEWLKSFERRTTVDALMEVLEGWQGLQDEEGQDLPFSRAHLALVLDQVHAAPSPEGEPQTLFAAVVEAYMQACSEAEQKN